MIFNHIIVVVLLTESEVSFRELTVKQFIIFFIEVIIRILTVFIILVIFLLVLFLL